MIYKPYDYQIFAGKRIRDITHGGLLLDMGLGKTVITLTELNRFIYREAEFDKALVIGPKNVILSVWQQEAKKWDHLKHLKFSVVWGDEPTRIRALRTKADIYLINRENVVWLVNLMQSSFYKFGMVVVDELSSFKNHASKRFKALKLVRPQIPRFVGLTGTPAPNGLIDLWAQVYLMDQGERLEKNITGYRERYFVAEKVEGYISTYRLRKEAEQAIYSKISDICVSMKSEDYLELPPLIENNIYVELSPAARKKYDDFEEEQVMLLKDKEITAMSAAALSTKLLQLANGAIYHEEKHYVELHQEKLDALENIIEEAQGQSMLVFYTYQHDLDRILKRFPKAKKLKTDKDIEDWNLGKIPILVAHPASAGHGLNLQHGGHILVWFGQTWSLELYQQAIKRLLRMGQKFPVIMHRIIARKTIDEKVIRALALKANGQEALMQAVKAIISEHVNK